MDILAPMLIGNLNSRVYYVTPEQPERNGELAGLVQAALRAGVGLIQYRPRQLTTREMVEQASELVRITRAAHVPLVVNDRVDLALAVGADGVHLGAEDMPIGHARRMLGPAAVIGASCATAADARVAEQDGATYALVGPVGDISDVTGALGLERIRIVRKATSLPVCVHGEVTQPVLEALKALNVELVCVSDVQGTPQEVEGALRQTVKLVSLTLEPNHVAP